MDRYCLALDVNLAQRKKNPISLTRQFEELCGSPEQAREVNALYSKYVPRPRRWKHAPLGARRGRPVALARTLSAFERRRPLKRATNTSFCRCA